MKELKFLSQTELISRIKTLEAQVAKLERSESDLELAKDKLYHNSILLESSVEGPQNMHILSLDKEYCYLYFNSPHAQSMQLSYGADIKLGDCIFDHIQLEADIIEVKKYYDQALAGSGHISIRESGSEETHTFFETFYNPIYDKNSVVVGVAVFAQNITARKQAEDRVRESDALRELLLDIITHDLRNPAGVILSMSQMVKEQYPENELIHGIFSSSERLLQVLNDTSILSQATFGESIPREPLNLKQLLLEIADDYKSQLQLAEMELDIKVDPDLLILANHLIGEVFKNYISNAIKYASMGKRIEISADVSVQNIEVYVRDYGQPIQESDRSLIFERRVQLDGANKRGRGLGLAIVKRIAQAHEGDCWVEPVSGAGNKFCLRLPNLR